MRIFFCFLMTLTLSFGQQRPSFSEETQDAGIQHVYDGGFGHFVGGGVAVFDCNQDQFPDLYLAGGENPASFYLNTSEQAGTLRFEKQNKLELTGVTGAYPLDVNSDGFIDLMVLRRGRNSLFKGLANCEFVEANELWGFDGGNAWTTAFSATWLAQDVWPTLAVGNYIDETQPDSPFGTCQEHQLFQAENEAFKTTALTPSYCSLSMLFSDWNRSGTPSLRVSNDRQYYLTNKDRSGSEQLFYYKEGAFLPFDEKMGWDKLQIWGMGIASADLTGDGYPDYYITSMSDNKLRSLSTEDAPTYQDNAFARGITAHIAYTGDEGLPSTGWHAEFDDVNNDGRQDLFVAKGNVEAMPDFALNDPNNLLLQQKDGSFLELGLEAGIASGERGRGGAVVDLNLDGKLDIVVVNRAANAQVWRNTQDAQNANWVQLRLKHPNNSYGVGSWLELKVQGRTVHKEITVGGGHVSGELGFTHFGLGSAQTAQIRVHWFDGLSSSWLTLDANQFYTLGLSGLETWTP